MTPTQSVDPIIRCTYAANRQAAWKHTPREHNPGADILANEGADAVIDGTYAARSGTHGYLIRPDSLDKHTAFDARRLPIIKQQAINYLKSLQLLANCTSLPLLPETYGSLQLATSNLPLKDLAPLARFPSQRKKLAEYGTAKGLSNLSRHYCCSGAVVGGGFTMAARYLLLSGQYEADISLAFRIVISSFADDFGTPITLPNRSHDLHQRTLATFSLRGFDP